MAETEHELLSELARTLELEAPSVVSADTIIQALSYRVSRLMAANPDQLFSMLYRLDIAEKKIKEALASEGDVTKKIAVLIYERQLEKIISRRNFRSGKPDSDLAW